MKGTKKAYAKINFCLNVMQKNGEDFHELESLVCTVDLYDKITLQTRKDKKINLKVTGDREYVYNYIPQKDNAYKAVKLYMETYDTNGADIFLHKNIPLGSGMGGSSSCAAAALNLMEELYQKNADLPALANALGSDTNYLLKGGWAKLSGRGDKVEYLNLKNKIQVVAIYPEGGVNTAKCFALFDKNNSQMPVYGDIEALIQGIKSEEFAYKECVNGLQNCASEINENVKKTIEFAKSLSPNAVFLTGSGSTVCLMFYCEQLNRWAIDKAKKNGFNAELLTTVIPKIKGATENAN